MISNQFTFIEVFVWEFSLIVTLQVFREISVNSAPIVTLRVTTREWLDIGVSPQMHYQMLSIIELFLTSRPITQILLTRRVLSSLTGRPFTLRICRLYIPNPVPTDFEAEPLEYINKRSETTLLESRVKLLRCSDLIVDTITTGESVLIPEFVDSIGKYIPVLIVILILKRFPFISFQLFLHLSCSFELIQSSFDSRNTYFRCALYQFVYNYLRL